MQTIMGKLNLILYSFHLINSICLCSWKKEKGFQWNFYFFPPLRQSNSVKIFTMIN